MKISTVVRQHPRAGGRLAGAALLAIGVAVAGFAAGVHLEKGKLPVTASASSARAALTAGPTAVASGSGQESTGQTSLSGTVSVIDGSTLYVAQTSGATVRVTTGAGTVVSQQKSTSSTSVEPGDEVLVQASPAADGSYTASAIDDAGSTETASTSTSTSTSTASATAAAGAGAAGDGGPDGGAPPN